VRRRVLFWVGDTEVEAEVEHRTRDDRSTNPFEPDESFVVHYHCGEEAVEDYRDVVILAFPAEFRAYEDSL
jgi:hypothetical protein